MAEFWDIKVLIPLLVDDPLWEMNQNNLQQKTTRLNPSFSG